MGKKITKANGMTDAPTGDSRGRVPVEYISDGLIKTEDGRYVKIIEVLPTNFYLKSEIQRKNTVYAMASYLKIAPDKLQILVTTTRADIDAYCEQMEKYYSEESNEKCREMIWENAQLVNYLAENEAVTRHFFIVYEYTGVSKDICEISKEMAEIAETAAEYLDYCGLDVVRHENYDEFLLKTVYTAYHRDTAADTDFSALMSQISPVYGACGEENLQDTLSEKDKEGAFTVKDAIAPDEFDTTHKEYIKTDGGYYAYLYIAGYGYPTDTCLGWLSQLSEAGDGVSLGFYLEKKKKEEILKKISKTTMLNRTRLKEVEDTRTDFEEMDDAVTSGMYMKEQLNREGEDFYYMHTLIEITAPDPDTLEQRIKQIRNKCASVMMTVRRADYCHEQCFMSMLPLCRLDGDIEKKTRRNVLTYGAAAAFPFTSFELCDEKGILFGINLHNNSAVILDNYNSDLYSNGNMSIFGMSGAGKTYTLLLMAMRLRMCGVQVFIIAPEKGFEYINACEALGGQYIKIARGSADRINIMEIRRTTLDIDNDISDHKSRNDSVMLDVAQDVKTYLKLRYPDMTPEEGYLLGGAITECYASFGITKDNRSLTRKDGSFKRMPDLSHLYPFLTKVPELKNIAVIVKDLVDSGLAGQTNVDLSSRFIVIDTSSARDEDVAAATFTGTVFIRDELSRSRTEKKAVFGDELWVIAGKEGNEQAADFVIRLVKTVRGYGGIFVSATQNITDYFSLRDGKFGDSLLNNSRLKLLLQMEEPEAVKIGEKLGLSEEEVMQLVRSGRGQGLLCAGNNRIAVEIRSSKTEYDLITTNRADLEKRVTDKKR